MGEGEGTHRFQYADIEQAELPFAVRQLWRTPEFQSPTPHSSRTPPKNPFTFPVTFSGERLRNGVNGQNDSTS
jgi:hypothetical protein